MQIDRSVNVLIVDDDEAAREALSRIVRAKGIAASTAASLAEARASVASDRPDVVVVDIVLPDGDGMELVSDLDPAVAVIVVTGHASLDSAIDAVRKGASDYLTKPVDIERLWNLLDSFGQRRGRTAV